MLTQLGHSSFVVHWIIVLSMAQMFSNPSFYGSASESCIVFTSVVVFPFNLTVVTDIECSAFARHRTVGLPAHLTIACWRRWCNILLQYSSIFPRDLACHVRNSPIRDFNCVGVDNRGKRIIFGEISYNLEEFSSDVGFNIFAEGRVKIDAITSPGSVLLAIAGIYLIELQLMVVTSFFQGFLIRRNCTLKYFLIGRKFAKTVINTPGNVLYDGRRMI